MVTEALCLVTTVGCSFCSYVVPLYLRLFSKQLISAVLWSRLSILSMASVISQPKHPWCKKSCDQEFKKGCAEKDVKSKWAAKASCC